jgi:hypothetical protein
MFALILVSCTYDYLLDFEYGQFMRRWVFRER